MDFANAIARAIAGYSAAVFYAAQSFINAVVGEVMRVVNTIVNAYQVLRMTVIVKILRIARFLVEIWRFYLLATVCFLFVYIMNFFFGIIGILLALVIIGFLFWGAIPYMKKGNEADQIDLKAWDYLAKEDTAKRIFDFAIFLVILFAALGISKLLPKPIHVLLIESAFSSLSSDVTGEQSVTLQADAQKLIDLPGKFVGQWKSVSPIRTPTQEWIAPKNRRAGYYITLHQPQGYTGTGEVKLCQFENPRDCVETTLSYTIFLSTETASVQFNDSAFHRNLGSSIITLKWNLSTNGTMITEDGSYIADLTKI